MIRPKLTPHRPSKERSAQSPKHPINRASKVAKPYFPSSPNSPSRRYTAQVLNPKMTRRQLLDTMPQFNENTIHEIKNIYFTDKINNNNNNLYISPKINKLTNK